jgi:tetratricopeptide (TPR) repeat protein
MAGQAEAGAGLLLAISDSNPDLASDLRAAAKEKWPYLQPDGLEVWGDVADGVDLDETLYLIGAAAWEIDEHEAALSSFEVGMNRGDPDCTYAFGEGQLWMNNIGLAEPALERLVGGEGELAWMASGLLGRYYFEELSKTDDRVCVWLRDAARFDGAYRVMLASLLIARNEVKEAVQILETEIRARNDLAPIVLGNFLDREGKRSEAAAAYRVGIELGDAFSAFNLAVLLREDGKMDEATNWLEYAARHGDEKAIAILQSLE